MSLPAVLLPILVLKGESVGVAVIFPFCLMKRVPHIRTPIPIFQTHLLTWLVNQRLPDYVRGFWSSESVDRRVCGNAISQSSGYSMLTGRRVLSASLLSLICLSVFVKPINIPGRQLHSQCRIHRINDIILLRLALGGNSCPQPRHRIF